MKNIKILFVTVIILSAFTFTRINWKVKDDYSVKCSIGGKSYFRGLKAVILFDEDSPEKSKVTASIEAKTISTGNTLMDTHAREALDTDRFPLITFVSTGILKTNKGYEATGNLMIKGIAKEIKMPFTFDSKNMSKEFPFLPKETFRSWFSIAPREYNITRAGTPDEVSIELIIPVTK